MDDQPQETASHASLAPATIVRPSLAAALVASQHSGPPVEHSGWAQARTTLLNEIADGPALLALLGPPGTGKTWLLHTILADVEQSGRTVAIMSGGVLPFEFSPGRVALLDDATKMDAEALAPLGMLCGVTIVLAGQPQLADCLERLPGPPIVVPLAPLPVEDVPRFVATWLESHGLPADAADEAATARLFAHSEGVPRELVRLLRASLIMAAYREWAHVSVSCVDEVAAFREEVPDATQLPVPVAEAQLPPVPQVRTLRVIANAFPGLSSVRGTWRVAGSVAVAALGVAMLLRGPLSDFPAVRPPMTAEVLAPVAGPVANVRNTGNSTAVTASEREASALDAGGDWLARTDVSPQVPTREPATSVAAITGEAPGVSTAAAAPGLPQAMVAGEVEGPMRRDIPTMVTRPLVDFAGELVLPASPKETRVTDEIRPSPDVIAAEHDDAAASLNEAALSPPNNAEPPAQTTAMTSPTPTPTQATEPPRDAAPAVTAATVHAPSGTENRGAPGLALIAQAGDTMPTLYARIYRGVRPPPYAEFIAVNRAWSGRGGIVVFPAPADGWTRN